MNPPGRVVAAALRHHISSISEIHPPLLAYFSPGGNRSFTVLILIKL